MQFQLPIQLCLSFQLSFFLFLGAYELLLTYCSRISKRFSLQFHTINLTTITQNARLSIIDVQQLQLSTLPLRATQQPARKFFLFSLLFCLMLAQ